MAGAHFTIDTSGLRQIQERVQVMAFQFNPRPPLLTGESWLELLGLTTPKFQSTPAIADGRIAIGPNHRHHDRSFNPRPPLLTGES